MQTRFKVQCGTATETNGYWNYTFFAVYSSDPTDENRKYWEATPSFHMTTNIKGEQKFKVGEIYYLDMQEALTPV